jgi:hypothetical protein
MPRYQQAIPFDIVRSVKGAQNDIRTLQVAASPSLVRKPLNAVQASLNPNPYFWGMDPTGWAATAGSFSVVSDPPDPAPYPYAGLYTNDLSGAGSLSQSASSFPVQSGQQYLVQAYVNTSASSVQIGFGWQDSTHTTTAGPTNPTITVTPNTWTLLSAALTAPALADFAYPLVGSPSGDGAITYVTGITSQVASIAYQPGSSPQVPETWHAMGAFNANFSHGSPAPAYKLYPDNTVAFAGIVSVTSGTTSGTVFTLPTSSYFPISTKKWAVPISAGTPATTANAQITLNTSGQIILSAGPTGAAYSFALDVIRYPLDY